MVGGVQFLSPAWSKMDQPQLNWIANFIWGIADDVLRDLYVRGKYRDVILPMTVLRRLDAVLPTRWQKVTKTRPGANSTPRPKRPGMSSSATASRSGSG